MTTMSGMGSVPIDSPVPYGGPPDTLNPEELFVASINSCLMLVFFHFADKSGLPVQSYASEAEGIVEKTRNGLRFTSVSVRASIELIDGGLSDKIEEVARLAEKYCLISNSVSCPVQFFVEFKTS